MDLAGVVPLTEAAAFTFGCAVLRERWFDPERVSVVLALVAVLLVAALLVVLTPDPATISSVVLDLMTM